MNFHGVNLLKTLCPDRADFWLVLFLSRKSFSDYSFVAESRAPGSGPSGGGCRQSGQRPTD